MVEALDLDWRHAGERLDPKQRLRIRKRVEGGAVDLDRAAKCLGHPLPDAARLEDRDAVADDESARRLVRRVKEHRPQIVVLGLKAADDGVATPDVRESATVDIEREGSQGLLPGCFAIRLTGAVDVTSDD